MRLIARASIVAAALCLPLAAQAQSVLPSITQANIRTTICARGYTAHVRPSLSWSTAVKRSLLAPGQNMRSFELDHIMPLELGGAPTDSVNLQLQPWPEARAKDRVENYLHAQVCRGRMTLTAAQEAMLKWRSVGEGNRHVQQGFD